MALGSGLAGQIGYGVESTAGTPVTVDGFVPLVSDTLDTERGRVDSAGIIPGRRFTDSDMWNGGTISPGGDVTHELYNRGLGALFTGMFGAVTSSTGSGPYTHTWASAGDPQPLTVQKGVPATSGLVWPYTYSGAMVESWEIGWAAGEIVMFSATLAAMHEFPYRFVPDGVTTSGSAVVTSATAGFVRDDIGKPIGGTGIPTSTTIISVQSATSATMSANATASGTGVTLTLGIPLATASYPSGLAPFKYNHATTTFAGSALKVKSGTLSGNNGLDTDRFFAGQRHREVPLEAGLHVVEGSLEIEFSGPSQVRRYVAESEHELEVAFVNYLGESITFDMNVRVEGPLTPQIPGPGIVTQTLAVKAVGSTDADAMSVVVVSQDATP